MTHCKCFLDSSHSSWSTKHCHCQRTSIVSAAVSWVAPSPAPAGYEVFYFITSENNINYVSGGVTNTTELILTGLSPDIGYSIFVVAFGDSNSTLLSPHSETVLLPPGQFEKFQSIAYPHPLHNRC